MTLVNFQDYNTIMYNALPDTLVTPRLILRPMHHSDCTAVAAAANDWEVSRWMARLPHPYTLRDAEEWLAACIQNRLQRIELNLLAERKEDQAFIGFVGLFLETGELGYWVARPYWKNGYATEMAAGLAHWAFQEGGFDKLFSVTMKDNIASQKVLEKIGMRFDDIRDYDFLERRGGVKPAPHYILEKKDWAAS